MPKSLREHAIALAERGFCVFPLKPGKKLPAVKWRRWSTNDIQAVDQVWTNQDGFNIGIDTGKSGLLVVDVDNKRSKKGSDSLDLLEIMHDTLPETSTVKTPTGGFHYYFKTDKKVKNSVGRLGEGLDVRAEGGFVVAPSSRVEAGEYKWHVNGVPVADAPEWLLELCEYVPERPETGKTVGNLDETFAVRRAVAYLKESAPPAIEGDGGDLTTFKVACEIKDMGLSAEETLLLMEAHYNPRCTPPWGQAELSMKVRSAYKSGQNAAGASSPQADFTPIDPESVHVPTPKKEVKDKNPMWSRCVGEQNLVAIPPRDWIIPGRLITQNITLTVAPGGTGKSLFTILETLAVATGKNLTGVEPEKSGPVFIYNLEDPLDELYRRLVATCLLNDLPIKETLANVHVQSGIDRPLFLAGTEGSSNRLGRDCRRLEEYIGDMGFVAVCIDPLVRAHRVSENDNMAVDFLMDALGRIARRTHTAISVVHHTAKNRANEQLAGNIDFSRGASALINAARIAHTITTMDIKTAEGLHIDDATRVSFLRLDEGKINLSEQTARIRWYRKRGVTLPNGDNVGGLIATDLTEFELDNDAREEGERRELAAYIAEFLGGKAKTMVSVANFLQATEPHLYGTIHKTSMVRRIETTLGSEGIVVDGWCLKVVFKSEGNTHKWIQPTKEEDDEYPNT